MNMGKRITELREGTAIPGESRYVVEMGDGTGTKQVRHRSLVAQLLKDMEMSYDDTMGILNEEADNNGESEGE